MKQKLIFILKVFVIAFLFFWIVMVFTDYFRVRLNKNPMFCIQKVEKQYDDGYTYICTGLGYRMIKYSRNCLSASEFGPMFIKERTCANND